MCVVQTDFHCPNEREGLSYWTAVIILTKNWHFRYQ